MAFDKDKIPNELIEVLKNGRCGLFVGAGLSRGAGFPDWRELLEELMDRAKKLTFINENKIQDYEKLIEKHENYLTLAEDLREELGKEYEEYIYEKFVHSNIKPTKILEELVKLPVKFIITTNYDSLIEDAYNKVHGFYPAYLTYKQSKQIASNLWKDRFFVLKAHGDVRTSAEEIILTEKDYRKILFSETGYQSVIQAIFTAKTVLLIGASFKDPELKLLLSYLHHSFHGGGPTHYILLPNDEILDTLAKRYLRDFNLHTINFDKKDNYQELFEFIQELVKLM